MPPADNSIPGPPDGPPGENWWTDFERRLGTPYDGSGPLFLAGPDRPQLEPDAPVMPDPLHVVDRPGVRKRQARHPGLIAGDAHAHGHLAVGEQPRLAPAEPAEDGLLA